MESLPRLVLMASGNGTNVQAVIDACDEGRLAASVVAVISDVADARALGRAVDSGIASIHVGRPAGESRADFDARLAEVIARFDPDQVVLLGWMRVLTMSFLGCFPGLVINLHPALPGELAGLGAIERAWDEFARRERTFSGVMIHRVPDEAIDVGPVLAARPVPMHPDDTVATFAARMHAAEQQMLVETLTAICRSPRGPGRSAGETPPSGSKPDAIKEINA